MIIIVIVVLVLISAIAAISITAFWKPGWAIEDDGSGGGNSGGSGGGDGNRDASTFIGLYRSEEHENWNALYKPDKTLKPLGMRAQRIQLSIRDRATNKESAYYSLTRDKTSNRLGFKIDDSQSGILNLLKESCGGRVDYILVTIGLPTEKRFLDAFKADRTSEWQEDWKSTCADVARDLKGRCGLVEILGEPDLVDPMFGASYGGPRSPEKIAAAFRIAMEQFRSVGGFRLGGCGFAVPESAWVDQFLGAIKNGPRPDYISYHAYLEMRDGAGMNVVTRNIKNRHATLMAMMKKHGFGDLDIIISEYHYTNMDIDISAGFKNASLSCRRALTGHANAARNLQSWYLVRDLPQLKHVYFCQGVGQTGVWMNFWLPGPAGVQFKYNWSYLPVVVYHADKEYQYRASYYAWWMLQSGMRGGKGKRMKPIGANGSVMCMTSGDSFPVLLWNTTRSVQTFDLSSVIDEENSSSLKTYIIDQDTFPHEGNDIEAIVRQSKKQIPSAMENLGTREAVFKFFREKGLKSEATAFITT